MALRLPADIDHTGMWALEKIATLANPVNAVGVQGLVVGYSWLTEKRT
jgi:hypothetical protein